MIEFIKRIIYGRPWDIHPCGCRSRENTFCPIDFEYCKSCWEERLKRPVEIKKDSNETWMDYGPIC